MCHFLPQMLLFLTLFGANLYLMCNINVGLDQELALPKVSLASSQPLVQRPGRGRSAQQVEQWWPLWRQWQRRQRPAAVVVVEKVAVGT